MNGTQLIAGQARWAVWFALPLLVFFGCSTEQTGKTNKVIPFALTSHHNMLVNTVVNDHDSVVLMLHTAVNAVSLITAAASKTPSVNFRETVEGVKSWGGEGSSRYAQSNTLSFGNLKYDSLVIWESQRSGHDSDGKFGLNIFAEPIVEINFDRSEILLHDSLPALTDYRGVAYRLDRDMIFIEGLLHLGDGTDLPRDFLLHSGYSGTILLDDEFAALHELDSKLATISESELTDSQGNVLKTKKSILPKLSILGQSFDQIPVSFFAGAIGRQKMSVMGGDLLRRFNLIIDRDAQRIYMKPSKFIDEVFDDS